MNFFIASVALLAFHSIEQSTAIKVPLLNVREACLVDNKCELEPSPDKVVCVGNKYDNYLAYAKDKCHFESNLRCQRYPHELLEYMEFIHDGECTEADREMYPVLKENENVYPPISTAMRTDILKISEECEKENGCESRDGEEDRYVCGAHIKKKHLVYARSRCVFDAYHKCHGLTADNSYTFLHDGGCNVDDLKLYPAKGTFYG